MATGASFLRTTVACVLASACAPSGSNEFQTPFSPRLPSYTVSGVVVDHMLAHSAPRAGVLLRVSTSAGTSEVVSDETGHYAITVPGGPVIVTTATGSGYRAPCPPSDEVVNTDRVFNVDILAEALLTDGDGSPSWSWPPASIPMGGIVFERTSSGLEPIAGASIEMTNGARFYSSTMSNGTGRYALCASPPRFGGPGSYIDWNMHVTRDGFKQARVNLFDWWEIVDVELVRQ